MNKVKPQAGQVWKFIATGNARRVAKVGSKLVTFSDNERRSISSFLLDMEFAPQNDLEWLAVNVDKWFHGDCDLIRLSNDNVELYTDDIDSEYCSQFQYYTRQQWQSMRYKLGLDEKPRISGKQWAQMLRDKQ